MAQGDRKMRALQMGKQTILSIRQREAGLINLIEDAHSLGFNMVLIKDYKSQLGQVQQDIKEHKEELKKRRAEGLK